jgi:hypothetical protein
MMILITLLNVIEYLNSLSGEVGSTITFWNLLSSARPSLYAACTHQSRCPNGLNIASGKGRFKHVGGVKRACCTACPTMVCISSIKRMTFEVLESSFNIAFILSSNCPLYFVPATMAARSVLQPFSRKAPWKLSFALFQGETFDNSRLANAGIADYMGLFFFLLLNI